MAIFTAKSRVARAMDFYSEPSIWWGIGGTTAWPDESDPGIPAITDEIKDIFAYKQNYNKNIVRPATDEEIAAGTGLLTYKGSYWKIIEPSEAFSEGARWVFLRTELEYQEVSTATVYRKLGIFTGLQPVSESHGTVLTPSEVSDVGVCEVLEYRKPVYRDDDQREILNIVLEF